MMNDIQKWRVENLARFGFSDKFIASRTFDLPIEKLTKQDVERVTSHRLKERLLLSDYRLGKTVLATKAARDAVKAKRRARRERRVALRRKAG